jgi:hypothetical protein
VGNGAKTPLSLQIAAKAAAAAVPKARHEVVPNANHGVKPKVIRPVLVAAFGASA